MSSASARMKGVLAAPGWLLLWGPMVIVALYSFNGGRHALVWRGWSLGWYEELFSRGEVWIALRTSLLVAFSSATLATALSGGIAAGVRRQRPGLRNAVGLLMAVGLVVPEIVLAITAAAWFARLGFQSGWWTVVLAHSVLAMPFTYWLLAARLAKYTGTMEAVAADLGASPRQSFVHVTIPVLFPAVAAAWLLAFTISLDDVVIALFTSGVGMTQLSVLFFSMTKYGVPPLVNAMAVVILLLVGTLGGLALVITGWRRGNLRGEGGTRL